MKAELYMTGPEQEFSYRTLAQGPPEGAVPGETTSEANWLRAWTSRDWNNFWDRDWIQAWSIQHWVKAWEKWVRTWSRGWPLDWMRAWQWNVFERWPRAEIELSTEPMEPREPGGPERPELAIKPILQRLLLRRETDAFLAMDALSGRVFKLDLQAGEFVHLVQEGATREEAAKKLKIKKEELDKFLEFIHEQDVTQRDEGDG